MKYFFAASTALFIFIFQLSAMAEERDSNVIELKVGEHKVLTFSGIEKVIIGNTKVADAHRIDEKSFMLMALSPGRTRLNVILEGKKNLEYSIIVGGHLKRTTVNIKYADGGAMERLLQPYLTSNGRIQYERGSRALTVVDEPEVVDTVLKMIEQYDVRPPQLQLNFQLILAEKSGPESIPAELGALAKQFKEVFGYSKYVMLDKAFLATEANGFSQIMLGGGEGYHLDLQTHTVQGDKAAVRLEVHLYRAQAGKLEKGGETQSGNTTVLRTTVELRDGETAILGVSRIDGEGKALITMVSMKIKG